MENDFVNTYQLLVKTSLSMMQITNTNYDVYHREILLQKWIYFSQRYLVILMLTVFCNTPRWNSQSNNTTGLGIKDGAHLQMTSVPIQSIPGTTYHAGGMSRRHGQNSTNLVIYVV